MKAFTKLMALLMTLCILLLSFSACKKDPEPDPEPDSSEPESSSSEDPTDDDDDPIEEDPIEEDPIEEDPIEEIWDDDWGDDDWDDDDDDDEPELVQIAMEHVKARTATATNGITLNERISYILSPLDLGADRTGQEDCTDIIQACLDAAEAVGGGTVFLPAGYYRVEENGLNVPSGVTLRGEWVNPDENQLTDQNRGTVLMAYDGRGSSLDSDPGFITLKSAATLRNISIWYPEQSATNPQPYPNTIKGTGHTVVMNVTLYNSYKGFYNSSCSSMLIRGFYGTVLNQGIYGAEAYDIPRIEKIRLDTKYWEESNLPNSPKTAAEKTWLENYTRNNVIGVKAGRQDWGYWYDIYTNNVRYACMLVDGNDSIGKLVTRNTKVSIYIENMSYPGLEVSYSDLDATQAGIYYNSKGNETLAVSNTIFRNADNAIRAVNAADYAIDLSQCTFASWNDNAVFMDGGHLNISNTKFNGTQTTFKVTKKVNQAMLVGNTFAGSTLFNGTGWSDSDKRIVRDDSNKDIPVRTDNYDYAFAPQRKAATNQMFDVADYGAVAGDTLDSTGIYMVGDTETKTAVKDSTSAIQAALNAAKSAGGGIVYLHGGYYRVAGSLTVPTGVELRGTFEGPHYGNGTMAGTQICAYGGKGNANGTPLITMQKNSGATGFTVYYPEQGLSDKAVLVSEQVKAYPPTIRANAGTWIQNVCFTGAYVGIDAMTYKCDGIVISDVTGAVMSRGLVMGHGTNGGWVQNFHFNYSSWSGNYPMAPDGNDSGNKVKNAEGEMEPMSRGDLLTEFSARKVTGVELGDCKNVNFFSSFSISINTQIKLVEDPYTKGSFVGSMWGFAFDACHDGIYAESGNAQLNLYESMGVFNQFDGKDHGGHNVNTTEKFTGTISVWNTDSWSPNAGGIAYVKGGTVNYINCFPWCVYKGECFEGGTLNILGTTFVANNDAKMSVKNAATKWGFTVDEFLKFNWIANQGATSESDQVNIPDAIYHKGAKGKVVGTINGKQTLYIFEEEGANVEKKLLGVELEIPSK